MQTIFIEANGLRFEVLEEGSGDRLALCLHGFPEHAISWRHQIPVLAKMGYRVWAVNQRGYGRTTRPTQVTDYALPHLVDDVAALIDAADDPRCEPHVHVHRHAPMVHRHPTIPDLHHRHTHAA
jgi:pimeloyl-ACP methyl ester carboxylesterase